MRSLSMFSKSLALFAALFLILPNSNAHSTEDHKKHMKVAGGIYQNCFYCHSLQPEVHLTGPSLANMWGKKAGSVKSFKLYSQALKEKSFEWNDTTIRQWLESPESLVSGTTMTFDGIKDKKTVDDLAEFLKVAMGPNGFQKVVENKWTTVEAATGQFPKNVSNPEAKDIVTKIEYCQEIYTLTYKNKTMTRHWEINIDFKVNSQPTGPKRGAPTRINSGSMGDRFSVVFNSPSEISQFVKKCKK